MTQTLTQHMEVARDALLRSSAMMRSLLIAEVLPVRFRQDISDTVERCETGIEALLSGMTSDTVEATKNKEISRVGEDHEEDTARRSVVKVQG